MGGTPQSPSATPQSSYGGGSWSGMPQGAGAQGMMGGSSMGTMPMNMNQAMGPQASNGYGGSQMPTGGAMMGSGNSAGFAPLTANATSGLNSFGGGGGTRGGGGAPGLPPSSGGPGGATPSGPPNQNQSLLGGAINTPYWQQQYGSNPSGVQAMFSPPAYNQLSQFYPGLQQSSGPQAAGSNPLASMFQSGQLGK